VSGEIGVGSASGPRVSRWLGEGIASPAADVGHRIVGGVIGAGTGRQEGQGSEIFAGLEAFVEKRMTRSAVSHEFGGMRPVVVAGVVLEDLGKSITYRHLAGNRRSRGGRSFRRIREGDGARNRP